VLHDRTGDQGYTHDLEEKEDLRLRKLLESKVKNSDIHAFRALKMFHNICVDIGTVAAAGAKPLLKKFDELGGWPLLKVNWNEKVFAWRKLHDEIFANGFTTNYLINAYLEADQRDPTRYIVILSPPSTDNHMLSDFYEDLKLGLESDEVQAYHSYMVDYAVVLGANREMATVVMLEVLSFEIELCKVSGIFLA
jgi:predicted metalloendopeptidase